MPIDYLPSQIQPTARQLRDWALRDGPALALAALVSAAYAVMFLASAQEIDLHVVEQAAPNAAFGILWGFIGIVCVVGAVRPYGGIARWALTAWAALMLVWGTSYMLSPVMHLWERGFVIGFLHCALPVTISWATWRGHRALLVFKEVPNDSIPAAATD